MIFCLLCLPSSILISVYFLYTLLRLNKIYTYNRILTQYALLRISLSMNDLARTPQQLGTLIQRARKAQGWSQTELAERAGLRQATISGIETGEKPGRLDTILALLAALDLEFRVAARSKG